MALRVRASQLNHDWELCPPGEPARRCHGRPGTAAKRTQDPGFLPQSPRPGPLGSLALPPARDFKLKFKLLQSDTGHWQATPRWPPVANGPRARRRSGPGFAAAAHTAPGGSARPSPGLPLATGPFPRRGRLSRCLHQGWRLQVRSLQARLARTCQWSRPRLLGFIRRLATAIIHPRWALGGPHCGILHPEWQPARGNRLSDQEPGH